MVSMALMLPKSHLLLQAEAFPVHTANHLGPLTRLTVGYRPSFPGDRWHLNRVEVTDEGTGLLYIFFCSAWLGDDNTVVIHLQAYCTSPSQQLRCYGKISLCSCHSFHWCMPLLRKWQCDLN